MFRFAFLLLFAFSVSATDFYVSTNGSDSANGSLATPFLTLEKARAAVQALNGTIGSSAYNVYILQGTYRVISNPSFYLHYYDSGSPANPITYQAYTNADVHISGGLAVTNWVPVTNANALARLPAAATNSVYQANLSAFPAFIAQAAYGIQIGDSFVHQNELFWNGSPMTVAQYPNTTNWLYVGTIGSPTNSFLYTNANASLWTNTGDIMAVGFWKFNYLFEGYLVSAIYTNTNYVTLTIPAAGWQPPTLGQRYKFVNVLEELDTAGEYYLDRVNKFVYFWPPTAIASGVATISQVNGSVLNLNAATNLVFRGLTFEDSAEWLMKFADCNNITFDHCTNRNCASYLCFGETSTNVVFKDCDLSGAGQYGIWIQGGNRITLLSGGNIISNSLMHDCGRLNLDCRAAVISGVGSYVGHNRIYNIPAIGVSFTGNNHTIEYNELYNVCTATSDAGAIYSGNDWTYGGNVIRYNWMHDITPGNGLTPGTAGYVMGVYLDDCLSGVNVYGNCFNRVYRGIEQGGGRNNGITNNMFVDCVEACIQSDQRLIAAWDAGAEPAFETKLAAMPYTTSPWSNQYPYMLTILTDNKFLAMHDVISTSLKYGTNLWLTWYDNAQTNVTELNSFTNNSDAVFVNYAADNFTLQSSSPALAGGFAQIPFSLIGPIVTATIPTNTTADIKLINGLLR
jgi:hypothetical protein